MTFAWQGQKPFQRFRMAPGKQVTHGIWENMRYSTGELFSLFSSFYGAFWAVCLFCFFLPTGVASDEFRTTSTIYFSFFSWRKKIGSGTSITGNTQWQLRQLGHVLEMLSKKFYCVLRKRAIYTHAVKILLSPGLFESNCSKQEASTQTLLLDKCGKNESNN